jgi:hypothetical protein
MLLSMSEWYDSQKKPNSDFRKLLQERLYKSNPRRTLTADEQRRLFKLENVAEKLRRGENVQNRQLQTWLGEDEYAQVDIEWQEQLELREELKDKPDELKRYEDKLKEAIMMLTIARVRNLQHISWTASAKAYVKMR